MEKKILHAGLVGLLLLGFVLLPGLLTDRALGQETAGEVIEEEVVETENAGETQVPEEIAEEEGSSIPVSLEMHGRVQALLKATGGEHEGVEDGVIPLNEGFYIPRWRLGLTAEVFEHVWIDVEIGETENRREHSVNVLDANIHFTYFDFFSLVLGAQKTPFGRNHMTSSKDLEFIERPLVASQLMAIPASADGGLIGLGLPDRDVGIQFHGKLFEGILNYYAGIFNGTGEFFSDNWDGKFAYTARVTVNPLGDFPLAEGDFQRDLKIGIGGSFFQNNMTPNTVRGFGADLDLRWYGASIRFEWVRSEGFLNTDDSFRDPLFKEDTVQEGWYVQAGYFVWPNYMQLVGRFQQFKCSGNAPEDIWNVTYTTVGGNWYIRQNHNYKLQINYTWRDEGEESYTEIDNDALYILAQVAF